MNTQIPDTPKSPKPGVSEDNRAERLLAVLKSKLENENIEVSCVDDWHIDWLSSCTSTNDVINRTLKDNANFTKPILCISDTQTHGQGQHARVWHSPKGHLYLSLHLPTDAGLQIQGSLSLELALAILNGASLKNLSEIATLPTHGANTSKSKVFLGVKWPNDLVACMYGQVKGIAKLHPKNCFKFGGILLKPVKSNSGNTGVIFGVGINCTALSHEQKQGIDQPAIGLEELMGLKEPISLKSGEHTSLNTVKLVSDVVCACIQALETFKRSDCKSRATDRLQKNPQKQSQAPLSQRFAPFDALANQNITVTTTDEVLHGRAIGIADDGALRLLTQDSERQQVQKLVYHGRIQLVHG